MGDDRAMWVGQQQKEILLEGERFINTINRAERNSLSKDKSNLCSAKKAPSLQNVRPKQERAL